MKEINVWYDGEITTTFEMLGQIIKQPIFEKYIRKGIANSIAYEQLLRKKLIQRVKTVDGNTNRECYFVLVTKYGFDVFNDLNEKEFKNKEVKKNGEINKRRSE